MRPTVRQLEYVVAIAEEASFSRAARRCFVSQPAMSNQIRQLEMQLGAELFERTSKGVLLTPVGRDVVAHAREVLAASDRIVERARADAAPLEGALELGSISTVTPYLLPDAMVELRERFPDLALTIHDGQAEELEARLVDGTLDALVVPLPTGLRGCEEVLLSRDEFLLAAPADSLLGALSEPVSLHELDGCEILLLEDPHCLRRQALDVCTAAGARPATSLHATSVAAAVQLMRRGFGATLLPEIAVPVELSGVSDVRLKRFASPAPGRDLGLAWRKGSPREAGLRELAALLMGHCGARA